MIVEKTLLEGCTLLVVEGVIRLGESAEFFSRTLDRTLKEDAGHVLVDFSRINHMDSTGLGELVAFLERFRSQQRQLVLINPSERIRRLLALAELDGQFKIYDTVDEAIAAEV
ncbi:MAG: STAS domain-containing protein [Thermoanaerobaculia bacterium]|nr:STAS domain-containing protein [Thermoanaerobaculia bacterium]